ncbi:uncharacterized protein LOC128226838 [Mya arenaria]|uniref:uncharacterized protein LOC128217506 n=1 Tax=Mya arenaria TaxID=6604 RepID=UPI0022E04AE3|nr:uncharacterized protein LOC128217506 [Mya arenaria]XP_052792874.1 uncharacterized protein LOC128226838 [Mya arenaria]
MTMPVSVKMFMNLFLLAATFLLHVTGDDICEGGKLQIVPDPKDCAGFVICHGTHRFRFSCSSKGPPKVFDPLSKTCVLMGTTYDHSKCSSFAPLKPTCVPGQHGMFPDPYSCAKYYQCTGGSQPLLRECPYPRLYDPRTYSCRVYMFVKCGARRESKDPCDYKSNQCAGSGCIPCRARFGTCLGKPNGPNAWEDKLWTPHFLICRDERVILQGDCRQGGKLKIFNPFTRRCMPMADIYKMMSQFGRKTPI